ncbi:hypothetical protein ZTR_10263 [Talaromyces verruculosus]|nr:hypothetical protein ZTR_10263 [Talaromyces verruculosus]
MAKITIVGAGIVGLATASVLSRHHDITIIARDLPGEDTDSRKWASPWAGACFLGLDGSSLREQAMQAESFSYLWRIAHSNPESSVRIIDMVDIQDSTPLANIWYRGLMPEFQVMDTSELPEGAKVGMRCPRKLTVFLFTRHEDKTLVLNPHIFLPWLRKGLEDTGVKFIRKEINSLSELRFEGHDVLINATGRGSKFLKDVADEDVQLIRGQTLLVKTAHNKIFMRHGKDYTYIIPRLDGTAVLGGIKQVGETYSYVDEDIKKDILRRVHENVPDSFPSANASDYEIIRDNVGIRPGRPSGVRVETEQLGDQKVVHAYGTGGGGYVFSFGVGKAAANLVEDILYAPIKSRL